MANLPSGTVTFLFTDIEGSTKLAREYPETWEAARAVLLAGGASTIRQAIGAPLSTMARADLERMLAPARKLLGEEVAETVWSKGLRLGIEQIVVEAQEVL